MKILLLFPTIVASLFATTPLFHAKLDIYSNKTFLNKTYELRESGEITTRVPAQTALASIRYKMQKGCEVQSNTLSNIKKEINPNLQILRDEKRKKSHELEAFIAKDRLLRTISLKEIGDFSKIDRASSYLTKNLIENFTLIDGLKKEIEKIDKKLREIASKKESYRELTTLYTCKTPWKKLKISYPLNGIKYTPFYNINANTNNKSVSIEKKATLYFKSVESFEQIDINIHSYRFNQSVAPQPFRPRFLGQNRIYTSEKIMNKALDGVQAVTMSSPKIQHQESITKSLYKIKSVALQAGKNNLLEIDKEIADASFKSVIDAFGTNRAYLEARFKSQKNYIGARANLFLNQRAIASKHIKRIQKTEDTKLYFGEDEHIQVEKELVKTLDEKTFFGDKKISTQNWKYTISNKKPNSTNIEFIERVPISKDADIVVKTLALPEFDSQSAEGKTIWNFRLEPNRKKEIIFGYEVSRKN